MTSGEMLDGILLCLADEFEAGNRKFRYFKPSSPEEFEPLRECLAILLAEGSVTDFLKTGSYQFTPSGYGKYKPRLDVLRTLPR